MEELIKRIIAELVQAALPHLLQAHAAHTGQQNNAALGGTVQPHPTAGAFGLGTPAAAPAPAAGGMFGTVAPAAPAEPTVTPDMVQALITPLVQNEQVKAALTAQMQAMGIANLPDTTPAQLPELYKRFQEVDRQARAAGLIGGGAAAAPTII